MARYIVQNDCRTCMTTGVESSFDSNGDPIEIDPCSACGGSGYRNTGISTFDDSGDMIEAYLLVEALDVTEYDALTDSQKLNFITLMSAGMVDVSSGSNGRSMLVSLFGAGTTTRTNMLALLT